MVDLIVVCAYGPQDLRVAPPYNKAFSDAEVALYIDIDLATFIGYDRAGSNAMLSVDEEELSIFDLFPRCWL